MTEPRRPNALIDAPCLFCDYNGQGYWQPGTHQQSCPWREVGGMAERIAALPGVVHQLRARLDAAAGVVEAVERWRDEKRSINASTLYYKEDAYLAADEALKKVIRAYRERDGGEVKE